MSERELGWALALISVAQLMVILDASIATIALPYIGADLNMGHGSLTWVVTAYALALGGLLLLGGRLGDLYGRRLIFTIGMAGFGVASLLGGLAFNEATLLGARGLQGAFAALASPNALALIATTFPAGAQGNRAMGVFAMMSGVGGAIGLILGGWLTGINSLFGFEFSGWRLTFLINVPVGIGAALIAPRLLGHSDKHHGKLDVFGAITGTLGLLAVVYGLSRAGESDYGWDHWETLMSLIGGVALLLIFIVAEMKVPNPLLPLGIFRDQTRAVSFVAMMVIPASMFAMFFFLSLYVQQVMGFGPLQAGLAFLPFSLAMVAGSSVGSRLAAHVQPRILAGLGTLVAAIALFAFSRLSVDASADGILAAIAADAPLGASVNYWTSLLPWMLAFAFSMGIVFVTLMLTSMHAVSAENSGAASGVLSTMREVGGALGLGVLGAVSTYFAGQHASTITPTISGILDPEAAQAAIAFGSFPVGATQAFSVAMFMMLAASLLIFAFLNVRREDLARDGAHASTG